jgi:transcriptional regulator with XRE-family HTH domain
MEVDREELFLEAICNGHYTIKEVARYVKKRGLGLGSGGVWKEMKRTGLIEEAKKEKERERYEKIVEVYKPGMSVKQVARKAQLPVYPVRKLMRGLRREMNNLMTRLGRNFSSLLQRRLNEAKEKDWASYQAFQYHSRTYIKLSHEEILRRMRGIEKGKSVGELAKEWQITRPNVYGFMERAGVREVYDRNMQRRDIRRRVKREGRYTRFGKWFKNLLRKNKISQYRLAEELGLNKSTVHSHANGISLPCRETREKYAEFFKIDYWKLEEAVKSHRLDESHMRFIQEHETEILERSRAREERFKKERRKYWKRRREFPIYLDFGTWLGNILNMIDRDEEWLAEQLSYTKKAIRLHRRGINAPHINNRDEYAELLGVSRDTLDEKIAKCLDKAVRKS